jgi:topoisomerase-4 subunit A
LLIAASDGRFYTVGADKLPGGRGFGEPLRLMVDIDPEARIVALLPASAEGRLLLASTSGHGFVAQMAELIAETRKGRNVVNLKPKAQLAVARPIAAGDDSVAVVGDNHKLVVFPINEVPTMARGQGVILQRYKESNRLSDAKSFVLVEGLSWTMGGDTGRTRTATDVDLLRYRVARSAAGSVAPRGFPQNDRFD